MTFDDLPMLQAIYEVRLQMEELGDSPSSDKWINNEEDRIELTRRVIDKMTSNANQKVVDLFTAFRKSATVDGRKKIELIVEVAKRYGSRCFYFDRGVGECDEEVHLDRIIPGSRGGKYTHGNCVIACRRHNTMRADKSLEEFLSQPTTE